MVRLDGKLIDMPDAVRGFQRFTSEQRADHAASFRLGFRQREAVGETFWTHEWLPDICFPTRKRALLAALATRSAA